MSYLATLFIFILAPLSFENEPQSIKGIVKDVETGQAIPFAHVIIGNLVNVSNIDGEFIISSSSFDEHASLRISYMGYEEYVKPVKEIDSYHTIQLKPSVVQLNDVTVLTGSSLMEQVFDRFHTNYEMGRQHMIGYYRESMADWKKTYYVAEGIMDIYTPSNMDKFDYALVEPLRTRKKVFEQIDTIIDVLGGNASDMANSSIWRKDSFLSPKNRKNYEYFYAGYTNIGQTEVYIVEFEPLNSKGNTKGKLYIEEESLAILKIEYFPIIDNWKFWESVMWTEEYEQKDGLFEMVSVSFEGTSTNHQFLYNAILVINESNTINQLPSGIGLLGQYDTFFEEAEEDFTDSFWKGFNFMKLDEEVTQLLAGESGNY